MNEIIGSKGGSSNEHVHYEATDSLRSTSYARVLDLISEGEILGLANGLQSVYLDGTPVQNADGTMNFKDVTVDFRTGTQTQDFIPGFPDVENEVSVGVELKSGTPWVRAINNTALSAIRISLGVPALSQSDTTNGDIKGYKIDYKIELSKDGGAYSTVLTNSFNGKTTTPYQRSARIDLPAATTGWQVRVTRLTANANTAAIADMTTVVSYTEVVDVKLRYPMSAIAGIQIEAKQFPNIPTRAFDTMGRIVQVPSNYNAKTRAYSGNWDGTFKPSWTDNPAWIFRDVALNDRSGLGHRITAAQLDKWSLYAIARYCDGLVPDGKGGMEPRFTCNVYLQVQKPAYTVLQDLASVFRGISYWGAGSIIASADMPTDPVYVYTAANVIGGKFARVGSSKKTRYTTALVSWNDPDDMYKAKVEYTEDAEGITRYGIQQVSLTAFGCTSQGQAQRVGRWALATSRLETEMISFDVGMDGAIALPGQIIRVADPARMGRRNGGRIKTASGRVVVLDKAPTINAGDKLTVILPTGVSETRTVSSIAGDAVTVSADWSTVPLAQSVWSVDSTTLIAPMYKVRSVTEKDATTYTISATQHEPGKFDFVELGTAITPRPETALNVAVQQPPAAVTVAAYTVSLQDVQKLGFTASCAAVDGAVAYEGAFQADNSNWFTLPRQPGPVFDMLDVLAGNYTVKIAAVNSIGITSIATASAPTLVSKNANPKNAGILLTPSAAGFNVNADSSITPASITVHADLLDLDGVVSFSAVGATITSSGRNAVIAATNMPGAAATITASITALGQVFTKSIDIVKSADGAAGADKFVWIKYGTSAAGAGLTDNPDGMTYMGIAVNKSSPVESTVASDYTWSLMTGSNGADGASTFTGVIYKQQVGAPATPTGGSFNFATTTLTPPSGWSATRPASSTTPTWACRYLFVAATIGGTVTAGTWSAPVNDGQNGADGAIGPQIAPAWLYQWGSAAPAAPTGTSTLNLVTGANTSYTGSDGWTTVPPANPGTPNLRLYVALKMVAAAGGATSVPAVSYSGATVSAWTQNGANGANGAQWREIKVFQWALTIPAAPSGTGALSWATGTFGGAPANWSLAPGAAVPGYTLWSAKVQVTDTATATSTSFGWSTASIGAETFAGGDGLSYVTAYVATTVGTASTAPAPTTGKTSVPAPNSSGLPGTPQATVPTLTAGQFQMQFDGSYNKATDQVTWSIPYQTALKVGNLSAIATNTGSLTVTGTISSANGNFQVDANGNMIAKALASYAPDGTLLFSSGGGLTAAGAAPGTLNSDLPKLVSNLLTSNTLPTSAAGFTSTMSGVTGGWAGAVFTQTQWSPRGMNAVYSSMDQVQTIGAFIDVHWNNGNRLPVTPNVRYEFSAALSTHRCQGQIVATFYKGDGSIAGQFYSNASFDNGYGAGAYFGDAFQRALGFGVAPAGAVSLLLTTRHTFIAGSSAASYVFTSEMYVGVASSTQTVGAKYTDFSANGLVQSIAAAQVVADKANAWADASTADGILDRSEKSQLVTEWASVDSEWALLMAQAATFSITTLRDEYNAAHTNWSNYLLGLSPAWNDTSQNTAIDRAVFRTVVSAYYAKKITLQSYMASIASTRATAAGITGQMTAGQVANFIPPEGITDVQIGGNLKSTNWNGGTGPEGTGFLLERSTGNFYGNSMKLRGYICGGNYNGWTTPGNPGSVGPVAGGGGGFYCGPEGACFGNYNDGRYVLIFQNGDIFAPGFSLSNKQLTLTYPIIIAPDFTNGAPSVSFNTGGFNVSYTNGGMRTISTYTASVSGGRAPFQYTWSEIGGEGGFIIVNGNTSSATIKTVGGYDQTRNGVFSCTVIDANKFSATATFNGTAVFGTGG